MGYSETQIAEFVERRISRQAILVEDQVTNSPVLVRRASTTFNRVRGYALNVPDSRMRITEAMERCQS